MENKNYKSYKTDPTIHWVNVFHLYSSYRFMHLSCKACIFYDQCHNIKHKREICVVAEDINKNLKNFIRGRIYGFISDDFYVYSKHKKSEEEIKKISKYILTKYMDPEYVRS